MESPRVEGREGAPGSRGKAPRPGAGRDLASFATNKELN